MKYITTDGRYWIRTSPDGAFSLGLTKEYCDKLGPFWNYIIKAGEGREVMVDQQLAAVEAFCSNLALKSPIAGMLTAVNREIEQSPTSVSEQEVLFVFKNVETMDHLVEVNE